MSDFTPKYYTPEEAALLFQKQKENRWSIAQTDYKVRRAKLKKLLQTIREMSAEICSAIQEDFGKHPTESQMTELIATQEELYFAIKHIKQWMKPLHAPFELVCFGGHYQIQYEPKGQVLIFSPWNYPFNLAINPIIAAVAAGDVAILRPSEKTAKTSAVIQKLISRVFPENEVAVALGDRHLADALLDMPFDHFFFTGSPRIGQKVMCQAAKFNAGVTLELGGKSPAIVDKSANLDMAAKRLTWGKYINAGQTCIAPDYLLLDEAVAEPFLAKVKDNIIRSYGATPEAQLASGDFCSLVNTASGERLSGLINDSVTSGAKVYYGALFSNDRRRLSPTIVTGITPDMALMSQEIFGPILPVITYKNLDEAISLIQSRPKPLALYLFSDSREVQKQVFSRTTSGGSCINNTILHLLNGNCPFGGVGNSGLGNYHGEYGFRTMSHERTILKQSRFNIVDFVMPPYTQKVQKLVSLLLKHF